MSKVPVSVIIVTRNEKARLARCLKALVSFDEVIVVDSQSIDKTAQVSGEYGIRVVTFSWNGRYPKKRQWCLEKVETKYDWVFFVDADEVVPEDLAAEIEARLRKDHKTHAGFFVKGRYIMDGTPLRFGMQNNKLCLLHKGRMVFPVIDDLDLPGMGEIEGHYQPVLSKGVEGFKIGQLKEPLDHYAHEHREQWQARHLRYAAWERGMNDKGAWPVDPVPWRQKLKTFFRKAPGRRFIAFLHSYIFKAGFLDGPAGWRLARDRYLYYRMVEKPEI